MKYTEGYWLRSERANELYATYGYEMEPIDGGIRVLVPTRPAENRSQLVDCPAFSLEFTVAGHNAVTVRATHFAGYDNHLAKFELNRQPPEPFEVEEDDSEWRLVTGDVTVHVAKGDFSYWFEAAGRRITGCGFRNLAYLSWDRGTSSMRPGPRYLAEDGKPYMVNELSLAPGESVYGLGERFGAFVKNGQSVETWNEDGGTASDVAYKCVPFYVSNQGYGVFVNSTDDVSFEVGSEKVSAVEMAVPGESIEYTLFWGPDLHEVLGSYTALTGRPALPPAWSFGLWLSTSFTTNYDEKFTTQLMDGMAERHIPLSVFHYDSLWQKGFHLCDLTWDKDLTTDPKGMLARAHDRGLHVCVWINPYIAQASSLFPEAVEKGYLLQRADGRGVWQTDHWQDGMGIVDFTNPDAWTWFQGKLKVLLDQGVDCLKTDFGERIPVGVRYFDGSDPASMHNYYSYLYNKCVFELLERERGKGDAVLFARSATTGGQQFPVHWGGDCMATYPSMAETLRGGLSISMSGFGFWSHDISGFESTATPDLYKRWVAFGLLSSHSRLHGSSSYRVPWAFDDESSDVVREFTQLKCTLMPYLYAKAVEAHETGVPVMRPMVLEFTNDPACRYLDMQYMLGNALLVAPIFEEDGHASYYLPEGVWTEFFSGEAVEGGRWLEGTYDYHHLPLYVRPNTLLAMGARDDRPDYDYADGLVIRWYAPSRKEPATCRVVSMKGDVVSTATASFEGGHATLTLEPPIEGVRLEVIGKKGE